MQSVEKVLRLFFGEVVEMGPRSVQVGSAALVVSFRGGSVSSVDRGTFLAAKRGFAKQMLLWAGRRHSMRGARCEMCILTNGESKKKIVLTTCMSTI